MLNHGSLRRTRWVHQSAIDRIKVVPEYRPPNLPSSYRIFPMQRGGLLSNLLAARLYRSMVYPSNRVSTKWNQLLIVLIFAQSSSVDRDIP